LFEVRARQSFVRFTFQTNPLVISIFFQDFLRIDEEFVSLERRSFFNLGVLIYTKNLQKEGCFSEEESMVDFIII
tara:strand:+ start:220 stop:444 length:225 start_codon:yes stop_codon:yes gene_type:complete